MFSGVLRHLRGAGRTRRPAARAGSDCSTCATSRSRPACLLLSSFTCGMASIGAGAHSGRLVLGCDGGDRSLLGRGVPGAGGQRVRRHGRAGRGAARAARSCRRFSPWSAATGCTSRVGLLWLLTMMAQVFAKGFRDDILRRILCFSLFWHALDIIWVALFTVVYLMGAGE